MSQALLALRPSDLRALAAALQAGHLRPPFTGRRLEQYLPAASADAVGLELSRLAANAATPAALGHFLLLLADSFAHRPPLDEVVEVVATGPDQGLGYRRTAVVVEQHFRSAEVSVLLAGYAVHQGRKVFRTLADRMEERPELQVRFCLNIKRRVDDPADRATIERRFVQEFRTEKWPIDRRLPEVYYDPRSLEVDGGKVTSLHAKCVVVDRRVLVVSSANFTQAALTRNIELGLEVRATTLAGKVEQFFTRLIAAGRLVRVL